MVPLLLQNKPPILEGREDDELADLELRPEQVRENVLQCTLCILCY